MSQDQTSTQNAVSPERWAAIRLLALDVDGTLTDGSLTFDSAGQLLQTYNVRDGFGLVAARRAGLIVAWISGRDSEVARHRFRELGGHHCLLACADKAAALEILQAEHKFSREQCCFVGDDLPDLPAFARVGVRVAVNDADSLVLRHADYITQKCGGHGAVREVVELILQAQGEWDALLDRFTRDDFVAQSVGNTPQNSTRSARDLPHGG